MRGRRCVQFCAALALMLPLLPRSVASVAAQGEVPGERLILALFRADIVWSTWAQPYCDLPSGLYVSADSASVERHIREAMAVGIDAFIQPWYGPSMAANATAPNFRMLLEQAALVEFAAAAQVDLTSPLLDTTDEVLSALAALGDDLTRRPGYLVLRDKPIVFFLGQQRLSLAAWEALRARVDPTRRQIWVAEGESTAPLGVFDGLYVFDPDRSTTTGSQLSQWGSQVRIWEQANGAQRFWVATVMPGYDDRLSGDPLQALVVQRNAGATYRDHWAAADASDPDWILIRSLNEWDHCTHIERSIAFGDSYMGLTADLVGQYRRPEEPATVTPSPVEPTATPTLQEPADVLTPTLVATETAEPTATPEVTPTATLTPTPTATPFRLATPTPPGVLPATHAPETPEPDAAAPEARPTTLAYAMDTATPEPRSVVEGDTPRSCLGLPMLLTVMTCWGARAGRRRRIG